VIVYFSSVSENTHRFVEKLDIPAIRLPLMTSEAGLVEVDDPYVLVTPTYGADGKGFVPKQVVRFLNQKPNRELCVGVVGSGNTNFGEDFALAGFIVSEKLNVPLLHVFELSGMPEDVESVTEGLKIVEGND
jgi:protein involved in ribonucleotide reduction